MVKINPLSWLSATMRGPLSDDAIPGTIWNSSPCSNTTTNDIRSLDDTGRRRRVCFRNCTDQTLILCFVDEQGRPHHFHPLEPHHRPRQFLRGGGDVIVTADDHVESTWEGHAFLLACADDVDAVRHAKSFSSGGARIIGGFRPESDKKGTAKTDSSDDDDDETIQLVEVYQTASANSGRTNIQDLLTCCRPSKRQMRHNDHNDDPAAKKKELVSLEQFKIRMRLGIIDPTPIDTTQKSYECTTLGGDQHCSVGGWPVRVEPGSLTPEVEKALAEDLDEMIQCLPAHAVAALRETTPIYINKNLKYGPKACPITARGMCFHPGSEWLDEMGMCVDKCECVELYQASEYTSDRPLWGRGGVLIHEFSHAYHHKCCEDGYENKLIQKCYDLAMKEKLYESVAVHGSQGPKARAYACTDAMEYFAELSTAFLGGAPERLQARRDGEDFEFNKWYPFNRKQIQEHDPRAFDMLKTIWKVE